ncbi:hypothetical protein BD414DRAFT_518313 [Trametes punicea]|nr:hypothetical protein BD414DRAFT_518313 [Trametes punicea]
MDRFYETLLQCLENQNQGQSGPRLKDPETFNEAKNRYSLWKFALQQYVAGGPGVDVWKEAFSRAHYNNGSWNFADLAAFWTELDKIFNDPNAKHTAQMKLESLKMKGSAQRYFTEFEQLVTLAYYGLNDEFVLNILQRNAREDFI